MPQGVKDRFDFKKRNFVLFHSFYMLTFGQAQNSLIDFNPSDSLNLNRKNAVFISEGHWVLL
jgi:hypothetical protein